MRLHLCYDCIHSGGCPIGADRPVDPLCASLLASVSWHALRKPFQSRGSSATSRSTSDWGPPPGPIVATGSFVYDADLHQFVTWNITVSGAADPTLNFTFTPATSFIPSVYLNPAVTQVRFVRTLPGNPVENPFGTNPFDSNSVLINLDFFASPGNAGLTNAGGTITVVTGATQLYQIATNTSYGVRTGAVTTAVAAPNPTPIPSSMVLVLTGISAMILFFGRRLTCRPT